MVSEVRKVPVVRQYVGIVLADVGPPAAAVIEGQTVELVEIVFEGVQCAPLVAGQAFDQQPAGARGSRNECGIDEGLQCRDTPAGGLGARASWHPIQECEQDLREAQTPIGEQRGHLPR